MNASTEFGTMRKPGEPRSILAAAVLAFIMLLPLAVFPQALDSRLWEPDGSVAAVARSGNTLYVGGRFTTVGPHTGSWVELDPVTESLVRFPDVDGVVEAAASDGSGGWYIAGDFRGIGRAGRQNLAHVLVDGSLSAWNPAANNAVFSIVVKGRTVYVGGRFTSIGGQPRSCIAAVDAETGSILPWNPESLGRQGGPAEVFALVATASTVYAGGSFWSIGGQPRIYLAELDAITGAATPWNPGANSVTYALAIAGSTVYAGGMFTTIAGEPRRHVAAIDAKTGSPTAWNPGTDDWDLDDPNPIFGRVFVLTVHRSKVYMGGLFKRVGGESRSCIAAVDAVSGVPTPWNPAANRTVRTVVVSDSMVYVGGGFTEIGGQPRNYFAAVDTVLGMATSWDLRPSWAVTVIAMHGSKVFAGGEFGSVGVLPRRNIAALDLATGKATDWNPGTDALVKALVVNESTVFAGGMFTMAGGQPRRYLAAIDAASGRATPWDPTVDSPVWALAADGSSVYVGGNFTTIGSQSRDHIAKIDVVTGAVETWNPGAHGLVSTLLLSGSILYVGGSFTRLGGEPRDRIGALDARSGALTSWNPSADEAVWAIATNGSTVYVGGRFTSIGGMRRFGLAALDAVTGAAMPWGPGTASPVYAIAVRGSNVYIGGEFSQVGDQSRRGIAALNAITGALTPWNPGCSGAIWAFATNDSLVYAGGGFQSVSGRGRNGIAAIYDVASPLQIYNFTAQPQDHDVILSWQTTRDAQVWAFRIFRTSTGGTEPLFPDVEPNAAQIYVVRDVGLEPGRYTYRIAEVDVGGTTRFHKGVEAYVEWGIPPHTKLYTATPNPFNSSTILRYDIGQNALASLLVFDIRGRLVRNLQRPDNIAAGRYHLVWDASDDRGLRVASGIYYVCLQIDRQSWTTSITYIK